jgi:RNA polymerase sigma-32 factor
MTTLALRHHLPPVSEVQAYSRAVQTLDMLSASEELALALRVSEHNDAEAAWILAQAHLRLPVKVARDHRGYGLPAEDLIQEGNMGLLKAIKKFNPLRGVRLSVVALYWIQASVRAYIMKNWRMVKIATTKTLRKLFFSYKEARSSYQNIGHHGSDLDRLVADKLNVKPEDLRDFEMRLLNEVSLDQPLLSHDDSSLTLGDTLVDHRPDFTLALDDSRHEETIHIALATLPERTQKILNARYFNDPPVSLQTLSNELSITVGRVHQIEKQGLTALKRALLPSV